MTPRGIQKITPAHQPISERTWQRTVMDLARRLGWLVYHPHDSRRQVAPGVHVGDRDAAGYPDLTLVRERIVFAELKRPTGRVTPAQRAWIDALRGAGAEVHIWRPRDWEEVERILTERHTRAP